MFEKRQNYQKPESSVVLQLDSKINLLMSNYKIPAGQDKKVILNKILAKIEEGNIKQQEASKIFFLSPVYRIAISTAAFLLLIFLLHFFISTIQVSNNSVLANSYYLPDESRILMDVESEISYPRYWWKREVKLTGDAYFEVSEGKKFTVKTAHGRIEVIGTRFYIQQFENGLHIRCFSGMVKIISNKGEELIPAGSSLEIRDNELKEIQHISDSYPDLARFNQHFSQVNIKAVAEEIEYFFNVKIEMKDTTILKYFSGNINTTNCKLALDMLCKPLSLKYEYDKKNNVYFIEDVY